MNALRAGVTSIGNLSQFFSHEAPGWRDHVTTTIETVKAVALMGALRDRGVLMHSYLEDGYGALFLDCATMAGWAFLERYIVEELLGAKLSHCIGGLTTDPIKRAGWIFALDDIHDHDCLGTMVYGDTISFTSDFTVNSGLIGEYLLWDIMVQMECPTGHAVLPLPVTEGFRVPSTREIIEAQILGGRIEETARRLHPHVSFDEARAFARTMVESGRKVYQNAMDGLQEAGVDIRDPVRLLYVLKKLGPAVFEEMFGAGRESPASPRRRAPVIMTDVFAMSRESIEKHSRLFRAPENKRLLQGRRLLIVSTDVHELAIMILHQLCTEAGAASLYLGAEKNPDEVAAAAVEKRAEAILISTHNGMALEYGRSLKDELRKSNVNLPVIMGGILNQKVPDRELPVDVTQKLIELGFHAQARQIGGIPKLIGPREEKDPDED